MFWIFFFSTNTCWWKAFCTCSLFLGGWKKMQVNLLGFPEKKTKRLGDIFLELDMSQIQRTTVWLDYFSMFFHIRWRRTSKYLNILQKSSVSELLLYTRWYWKMGICLAYKKTQFTGWTVIHCTLHFTCDLCGHWVRVQNILVGTCCKQEEIWNFKGFEYLLRSWEKKTT